MKPINSQLITDQLPYSTPNLWLNDITLLNSEIEEDFYSLTKEIDFSICMCRCPHNSSVDELKDVEEV